MKLRLLLLALVYAAAQAVAAYTVTPVTTAPDWHVDWNDNQKRPNWQAPDASAYENFTVMFIKIEKALQPYATGDDLLAIFVGDELRGLAKPASVVGNANASASTFVLKAFSSESNGDEMDVILKYYNAQLKSIFSCSYSFIYDENEAIGVTDDFVPAFTLGSPKFPLAKYPNVSATLASAGITPANGDMVGAFVGDECRGVATFPLKGDEPFTVYLREEGETVTLKYYDAAGKRVITLGEGSSLPVEEPDDTDLGTAISQAERYYNGIKESYPYPASVLLWVINSAKGVLADANAKPSDIEYTTLAVNEAVRQAKVNVAKIDLITDITEAEAYYNSIKDSYPYQASVLLWGIDSAKDALANANASQSEIDLATYAVNEAVRQAKVNVARTGLGTAISEAETYYNSIKESYPYPASVLLWVINSAKEVMANANASQSDIDLATYAMNEAVRQAKTSTPTGIDDAKATAGKAGDSYNLNGSRMTQPKKGIYIVNGKKVVLK